jgi:hypothetical protein
LTAGAVVQFALFSNARSVDGWKWHRRHKLALAGLVLAVAVFYGGPFVFDALTNTSPPAPQLQDAILQKMPADFSPFKVVATDYKFDRTGEQAAGNATLTLALTAPLYATDNFQKRAVEHGDDPTAYAAAVARSNNLPADLAPTAPDSQPPPLFSLAQPGGHQTKTDVAFTASKLSRGWSLADCLRAWTHRRDWLIGQIHWPALPQEFHGLVSSTTISGQGGVISGEDVTESTLRAYVNDRRAFIAAVAQAETQRDRKAAENRIADVVRTELAKKLNLASVYSVKSVKVDLPAELPSAANPQTVNAEAQVEQQIDLYRLAKEQPSQWPEFQTDSEFQKSKSLAENISSKPSPPAPWQPVVYELASPAHSLTVVDCKIQTMGSSSAPVVQNIVWPENSTVTDSSLVSTQDAGPNALFASQPAGNATLPAVQDYRNQIRLFIQTVEEDWQAQMEDRHNRFFVQQQPGDPHSDRFSIQDESYFQVYYKSFSSSYAAVLDAIPKALKDTDNEVFTFDGDYGAITGKFELYSRGLLDPSGARRLRILVTKAKDGVQVEVKTYLYIAWNAPGDSYTKQEIESLYMNGGIRIHGQKDFDPQYRNYLGLWTVLPDATESEKQSQLFLDKLGAELSGTPLAAN